MDFLYLQGDLKEDTTMYSFILHVKKRHLFNIECVWKKKSHNVIYQCLDGKVILSISKKILSYESIILIHPYHNHTVSKFLGNPGHSEMGVYHVPNVIVMACG